MIHPGRIYEHKKICRDKGPVIYWMSRDQRVNDNWSLMYAKNLADRMHQPMAVVFCLADEFLHATIRQYSFMLRGLMEVETELHNRNITFCLITGDPAERLGDFISQYSINQIVSDFDPLRIKRGWVKTVTEKNEVNFTEVDSHNIVPCRIASKKLEFGAYTLRPKLTSKLHEFLDPFETISDQKQKGPFEIRTNDWEKLAGGLDTDRSVKKVSWIQPGERNAREMLRFFLSEKLPGYAVNRNDPVKDYTSNLSPYLHFGHISPQRVAMEVMSGHPRDVNTDAFLEELIVRRELSDNYCFYNPHYDSFSGFHAWARNSLDQHRRDEREYLYSLNELEKALTHDPLWNAAQTEMTESGKMHGYMRMYWAKKILEWTITPEKAMESAVFLNDRYQLDGRDPNGYTGCAWAIGGVHDRAWSERPVFGKIRYMNYNGCKRKFNVGEYIRRWGH